MSDLRKLLDEATPGPWAYRPEPYDDWGMVRSGSGLITQARDPRTSYDDLGVHRSAGTDPWGPNARLISLAPDLAAALLKAEDALAMLVDRDISYDGPKLCIPCQSHSHAIGAASKARATLTEIRKITGGK